ncbi:MAG: hypothetical protein GX357_06400 [Firmicutes bacterium]|nr:hypothetical protein [Bacillota bacterium]
MEKKYGNLVKRLHFKENMGGTPARYKVYMEAADLNGLEVNFVIGVYEIKGLWAPKKGYKDNEVRRVVPRAVAHAHSFDELLLFFGYGEDGLSNLGAELNLSLGKEYEQHLITKPTIVAVPRKLPHCPIYTEKLNRPFAHMHVALSVDHGLGGATETVEQEGNVDGKMYSHLMKNFQLQEHLAGAAQAACFCGEDLQGINLNLTFGMYDQTGPWFPDKGAVIHPYDKLLIFFGNNADNPNDLGAEISVKLGPEGEEHIFSEATVIIVPKGTPHMPVVCHHLERPYYAVHLGFSATEQSEWLEQE